MFYGTIANFKLGILACCVKLFHKLWLSITTCFCTLHTCLQFELIITRVGFVCSLSLSDRFSCVDKPYLCCWLHCRTVRPRCNTVSALSLHRTVCALCPLMASPSTKKRRTFPHTSPTPTQLLPSDFPPGVWAKGYPDRWVVEVEHHHKQQRETWATF